jgi:DNA polymerase bacteriophage-type
MSNIRNFSDTQHVLLRDYETRGAISLKEVGAWRYCSDVNTSVLCCAYAIDDGPVKLWVPGDPVPAEWVEAANNPDWIVSAFNDNFERHVELHQLDRYHHWPLVPIERHRCLQASALSLALPASLEKVAEALNLEHQKDSAGKANMMALSRPRKSKKGEPPGLYWHSDQGRLERLYAYCKQDVETERALYRRIGFISEAEQLVWQLDAKINDRGIFIDDELALGAIEIDEEMHAEIDAELAEITGGTVTAVNQTARMISWLGSNGCPVDNVQKGTLGHAATRKAISDEARRVMILRRDGAHAATNKYRALMAWRAHGGRVRGCFRYHGTSTGRWSGLGPQPQNFKRAKGATLEDISAVKSGNYSQLRMLHPENPLAVVGDVARAALSAAPGHKFIIADFSGIEARVLAWLAGEESEIQQWKKFDETGIAEDEPYHIAGVASGLDRDGGKTETLAFGFMGGVGAYRKLAPQLIPAAQVSGRVT